MPACLPPLAMHAVVAKFEDIVDGEKKITHEKFALDTEDSFQVSK